MEIWTEKDSPEMWHDLLVRIMESSRPWVLEIWHRGRAWGPIPYFYRRIRSDDGGIVNIGPLERWPPAAARFEYQ